LKHEYRGETVCDGFGDLVVWVAVWVGVVENIGVLEGYDEGESEGRIVIGVRATENRSTREEQARPPAGCCSCPPAKSTRAE
jgi:hypothetical protein